MSIVQIAKVLAKPLLTALQASTIYYVKTLNEYKTDVYISDMTGTTLMDISSERLRSDTVKKYSPLFNPIVLALAYKDTFTPITAGTDLAYLRAPRSFLLKHVRASVFIPSTSTAIDVVVKVNGVNITPGVNLSIDGSETSSLTAVSNYNTSLPPGGLMIYDDDVISIDIVNAGDGATGLIVQLHEGQDTNFSYTA